MPLQAAEFLSRVCRVIARPPDSGASDRDLLQRFLEKRGEAEFTALVERHGGLVWQVCRRLLGHQQDAEDAFQATFLVLAQQAAKVRKQTSVKSWLYGVASHIALSLRRGGKRRRKREVQTEQGACDEPSQAAALAELQAIVAEEVARLPEKYRAPFVLCSLGGQGKAEAAQQLGWREGTLSSRLARSKEVLRARLRKRGVDLTAALCVVSLSQSAMASVPARLLGATVSVASQPATASATVTLAATAAHAGGTIGLATRLSAAVVALALLVGVGWSYWRETETLAPPEAKKPAADAPRDIHDAALPPGAVARLGTNNLRALTDSLHFAADGKTLVGIDADLVRTWDAADGKLLATRRLPVTGERRWSPSFRSRNGNTWLLRGDADKIEVWDVPSGKQVDLPMPAKLKRVDRQAISNDRRLLFLCDTVHETTKVPPLLTSSLSHIKQEQTLLLWNTETRKATVLAEKHAGTVTLAIAPDGKRVASSGSKGTHVWDVATGKSLWHVPEFNAEELQFTSDSQTLVAAPGGGQGKWQIWDAATGKTAAGFMPPTIGYVWTFALSADDTLLAAPTFTAYVVWDLKAGKVTQRWPGANQSGKVLFAPDGRSIILHAATLERYDLTTGKRLYADVSAFGHTGPVRRLAFTPDGSRLVSMGADETLRIWEARTSKLLFTTPLPAIDFESWALTPDGKTLLAADEKLNVHRWSLVDGTALPPLELKEARGLGVRLRVRQMQVSPDGKKLAVIAWATPYELRKYSFSFWDLDTGRLIEWGTNPGNDFNAERALLSPDTRHAAWYAELYSTTLEQRHALEGSTPHLYSESRFAFSSDSRLIAGDLVAARFADGAMPADGGPAHRGIVLWEKATAAKVLEMAKDDKDHDWGYGVAISPDGRWLSHAEIDHFTIYDLRTGKRVLTRSRPEGFGHRKGNWFSVGLAFAPDGRTAVSAHPDGNMLVWSLPSSDAGGGRDPLSERDAEALWQALGGEPKEAYAAHWRLRDDPEQALRLFRKRLLPSKGPPEEELKALIRDLGSETFRTRSKALEELRKHGRPAAPAVAAALKKALPLELKRRMETLVAEWAPAAPPTKEELRQVRAVMVLERLRTPEARLWLAELAGGAAEARLTQEAREALLRLGIVAER